LGVYHAGMTPQGTEPLPKEAAFTLDPPVAAVEYKAPARVRGAMLGCFGPSDKRTAAAATHALVVALDYKTELTLGLRGPASLEIFDAATGQWSPANAARAEIRLPGGGGKLVRLRR